MTDVDDAVAAIEAGELAIIPTDTVYGLAATPHREDAVRRLYRAKGRIDAQPTALVVRDLDVLRECLPELTGAEEQVARALLPGPYTLILPNPARRFPWLAGSRPETIGVRIPALTGPVRDVLTRVGALVATSANMPGGPDPRTLDQVPGAAARRGRRARGRRRASRDAVDRDRPHRFRAARPPRRGGFRRRGAPGRRVGALASGRRPG